MHVENSRRDSWSNRFLVDSLICMAETDKDVASGK